MLMLFLPLTIKYLFKEAEKQALTKSTPIEMASISRNHPISGLPPLLLNCPANLLKSPPAFKTFNKLSALVDSSLDKTICFALTESGATVLEIALAITKEPLSNTGAK